MPHTASMGTQHECEIFNPNICRKRKTMLRPRELHSVSGTGFIDNIRLHSAQRSPYGSEAATWVEMCTCPEGYVGQFCESCAPGYRHDPPKGGKFSRCVPCNCNGHALICEPDTGQYTGLALHAGLTGHSFDSGGTLRPCLGCRRPEAIALGDGPF